jgi:acetylornithine deacetylase
MPAIPPLKQMFSELIASPSVSSVSPEHDMGNRGVIELLSEWLEALGFHIEVVAVQDDPPKSNLIAVLGEGDDGLVLAGHTDTVPYDAGLWTQDPFTLTERDGKLFGLGTSDMKGFLAIAIEAARSFVETPLRRPLVLLATADEESTMHGAERLVELGRPRARYAVIGEPTGLVPIRMHKGVAMESLQLTGRSGHSSNPALGINAIDGMHTALGVLKDWRSELAERHRHDGFEVPHPTLNLGHIHGGDNPNRICGHCLLNFDMRLLPEMRMEALRPELEERLREALDGSGLSMEFKNLDVSVPAFETPADAVLVRMLEALTGHAARSVAFASEAPHLQSLGIETVVLGPGDIEQAHQPDEFLRVDRIQPTLDLLDRLIRRVCLAED